MPPSTITLAKSPSTSPVLDALANSSSFSSSSSSSSSSPPAATDAKRSKDHLASLRESAKWGFIMTTVNLVYGYVMVAKHLPPDPRQERWVMMGSPLPTYLISLAYVVGVTWLGPKLMEGRSSVPRLRPVMVVYNALQVLFSVWLVYKIGMGGWFGSYSLRCQSCDFSNDPQAITMLHASYWYYFSKFVDFLDTVFFVLNKKYEHISVLHIVHHSLMPVNMWYGVRYQPGGNSTLMGLLNSFVHVVMYLYYLLAALGPRIRPYLWWKKYLTTLQILQFITVMVHIIQVAFIDCPEVPRRVSLWVFGNSTMFLFLFSNFYQRSYTTRSTKKQQPDAITGKAEAQDRSSTSIATPKIADTTTRPRVTSGVAPKTMELIEASVTDHLRTL